METMVNRALTCAKCYPTYPTDFAKNLCQPARMRRSPECRKNLWATLPRHITVAVGPAHEVDFAGVGHGRGSQCNKFMTTGACLSKGRCVVRNRRFHPSRVTRILRTATSHEERRGTPERPPAPVQVSCAVPSRERGSRPSALALGQRRIGDVTG